MWPTRLRPNNRFCRASKRLVPTIRLPIENVPRQCRSSPPSNAKKLLRIPHRNRRIMLAKIPDLLRHSSHRHLLKKQWHKHQQRVVANSFPSGLLCTARPVGALAGQQSSSNQTMLARVQQTLKGDNYWICG